MTKPKAPKLCAPHELEDKLLELLRDGPSTSDSLARITGYSANAVRERLAALKECGHITRKTEPRDGAGMHYIWTANPGAGPRMPFPLPREIAGLGAPRQTVTKIYPAFNYRDPLVAAVFGPAGKAAP